MFGKMMKRPSAIHLVLWHNSLHQGKITGKQLVNYGDPCFFLNKA
jgi:hypothetical protein